MSLKLIRGSGGNGPGGSGPEDETLARALRSAYAPPLDEAYWDRLHASVMSRVAAEGSATDADGSADGNADGGEWWSFFDGWVGAGLAAAGLVAILAGLAATRTRTAEDARVAYEEALEAPSGVPLAVQTTARASTASTREAMLKYLISH